MPLKIKIAIMGTPVSTKNRGVQALGTSLLGLCAKASPGADLVLLLGNRDNKPATFRVGGRPQNIAIVNVRMSLRSRLQDHLLWVVIMAIIYRIVPLTAVRSVITRHTPWIKALEQCAVVGDVRGGDSFSDIYGLRKYLHSFLPVWTVILVKRTMVQFPQTYGPYKTIIARWLAGYLLKRSAIIIARDRTSQQLAQNLVGSTKSVLLSPDVAFSLEAVKPARIDVDPPCDGVVPEGTIGLNVNGLMYHGGYTRSNMFSLKMNYQEFLRQMVLALLEQFAGEIWLIPHSLEEDHDVDSDGGASKNLLKSLPPEARQRIRMVGRDYSTHELKWIIGQCDFFIGSRMHACIAALSQGVPCAGVAYSMKFRGVFESVGMADWVLDARNLDNQAAGKGVLALYQRRNAVRDGLVMRVKQACEQLDQVFAEVLRSTGTEQQILNGRMRSMDQGM